MITQAVKLSVKQSSGEKHKRTRQGASAKLESYFYCYMLVYATTSCLPYCYESKLLGLDSDITLYRVYTRELDKELCTE